MVRTKGLQMLGCACMSLACKLTTVKSFYLQDWTHVSANSFSTKELKALEILVFNTLQGNIFLTTPIDYYQQTTPVWTVNMVEKIIRLYFTENMEVFGENPEITYKKINNLNLSVPEKYVDKISGQSIEYVKQFLKFTKK